jgi:hypothetical protein
MTDTNLHFEVPPRQLLIHSEFASTLNKHKIHNSHHTLPYGLDHCTHMKEVFFSKQIACVNKVVVTDKISKGKET